MELQIENKESKNIIKVIGIGGAGNNAVNDMYNRKVVGIDYVVCNTDMQDLEHSPVLSKLPIGIHLTEGLGAGSIPESGEKAAEESKDEIRKLLGGSTRMVVIAAGMGGGTGTGASPVVARIAKEMGLVVVSIVTTPFGFERQRLKEAVVGIEKLDEVSDALLIINNQKLQRIYGDLSFPEALEKANDVLVMAAESISEIVTQTAEQNIDYADLEHMLRGSGMAVFGVGKAKGGEDRIGEAIRAALNSPLLDNCDILGAKSLLVNLVLGARNLSVKEQASVGEYMRKMAGHYQEMKQGTRIDTELLEEDEVMITIVATNFSKEEMTPQSSVDYSKTKYEKEPKENTWLEVENSAEIERKAEEKKRNREEQKRKREEAVSKAREKKVVKEEAPKKEPTKKPKVDVIEDFKKGQTGTRNPRALQGAFDFILGNDIKDDVEM